MSNNNPLLDNDFLVQLNEYSEREIYAKIIALDMDENPMEEISGHVTQGSVSLDGTSAIRRTCSLTMVAENVDINEYYWGLHTKVNISLGMKNFINPEYPEIIWFPQGIFVLTTFTTSQNVQGYTINLQGKDKMCLLNGDVGGNITALSVDFGKVDEEVVDDNGMGIGEYVTKDFLIKDIITEAVHTYAGEPYQNIIVNDLDEVGLELLEYRGKTPLYLIIDSDTNEVRNMNLKGSTGGYYQANGTPSPYTLETIPEDKYDTRTQNRQETTNDPLILYSKNDDGTFSKCTVAKITAGEVVGYRITDLTYAGDLIGSVGQSIVNSVLDPIVKQLGDFEYFYNTEGQFIFQRKKTYVNTSFNTLTKSDGILFNDNAAFTSSSMYTFENSNLITAFNNSPDLSNVKNDYSIWGSRKGVSGAEIPIHLRYAIDKKPFFYRGVDGTAYTTLTADEYKEFLLTHEYNNTSNLSRETNRKFGLTNDWWEVRDWAKAWEQNGLSIPTGNLGNYCSMAAVIVTDPEKDGEIISTNSTRPNVASYVDKEFLQDVWKLTGSGDFNDENFTFSAGDDLIFRQNNVYYSGHGWCAHPYTWWLDQFKPGGSYEGGYAFFFRPEVPSEILGDKEFIVEDLSIIYELDWREIIYQMALDYFKYGQHDSFLPTVAKNNFDLYPSGITGYEQYYTDMQGFWRQLYDVTLSKIDNFNYAKVYDWNDSHYCDLTQQTYDSWTEEDFDRFLAQNALYYKKEKAYIPVITWNPLLVLYIRLGENAPDHYHDTFYTKENNMSMNKHDEDEIVIPSTLYQDKMDIYYKNGTSYVQYVLYDKLPFYNPITAPDEPGASGDSEPVPNNNKGDVADDWIERG